MHASIATEIAADCHRHRHLDSTITQIVIPAKYQLAIVKAIHHSSVGGHLGQAKTVSMLMNLGYYFPSMRSIVNRVVSTCHQCQRANAHIGPRTASQLIFQREAARMHQTCTQPIILAYGSCASAKVCRHSVGVWLYAQLRQNLPTSTIALDPPINFEVSKEP